jgi:beta-xylosidase
VPSGLPIENYAPDVEVINGRMYFTAVGTGMFTTSDPAQGQWMPVGSLQGNQDPALFVDTDGKVYFYYGNSATDPIKGVELDASSFAQIGSPQSLITGDPLKHGWELKDPNATNAEIASGVGAPFIEGSWMTKRNGTYYLQYAAPGTELKWYADGVYTSGSPLGPFTYAPYSPFSLKATGFIGGTGHGSTFQDSQGRYWHADTALIGVRHPFERRLVVFPSGFVPTGSGPDQLVAQTYLGDYPII